MSESANRLDGCLVAHRPTKRRRPDSILVISLGLGFGLILSLVFLNSSAFWGLVASLLVIGVVSPGAGERRVKAGKQAGSAGSPLAFTLSLGDELVTLEPGKPWVHVDRYKWVPRGLIEEPQSFHVLRDGTVEINGEKIRLDDPDGEAKLEHEINKHHPAAFGDKRPQAPPVAAAAVAAPGDRARFKVRLDHFGHLMIQTFRGEEKTETGLRGLSNLIRAGLMLEPKRLRIDPLQRFIEVDDTRFESSEEGARRLEEVLNARYAPTSSSRPSRAIEIRENPASPTGFDIHFTTLRAGVPFEVKEHLSQSNLEILQDPAKSDLLKPGIQLRLAPPHLLVRRRRPDGGEEKVPDVPDIHYLRTSAQELEQVLNHPAIRRGGGVLAAETSSMPAFASPRTLAPAPRAEARQQTSKDDRAPSQKSLGERTAETAKSGRQTTEVPSAQTSQAAVAPVGPRIDATILGLFAETDPLRTNLEIFRRLGPRFGVPTQDVLLSLPRVFHERRFEIISLRDQQIESVLELRSGEFYGFYLSHISEHKTDFVYACGGVHIEWSGEKCILQPSAAAESLEFPGSALRGMAQTRDNQFVFVVTPSYKQWVRPCEKACREAFAHFVTAEEIAGDPEKYTWIWPERANG